MKKFAPTLKLHLLYLTVAIRVSPTHIYDPSLKKTTGEHSHTIRLAPVATTVQTGVLIVFSKLSYIKSSRLSPLAWLRILSGDIEINQAPHETGDTRTETVLKQ